MADPPELHEDVDLTMDERRYVLDTYARLAQLSHYALLQVPRTAEKADIKRSYFRLVNIVHPDRYFGKKLGTYKSKMEILFSRLSTAYEALSTKRSRAEYDAALGAEPEAVMPSAPVDRRVLAQRAEAMEALKQRFLGARDDRKATAAKHAAAGARASAAGDFAAAAEAYRLAVAATPEDAALVAAHAEARRAADARLADAMVRQATLEERYGHWAEAAATWKRVVDARPGDEAARARLAKALAHARAKGG